MKSTYERESITLATVFRPVISTLAQLARHVRDGRSADQELEELRFLLETLPLTTEQFSLATNRLKNAHGYVKARENGAARWELNALRQQLANHLTAPEAMHPG